MRVKCCSKQNQNQNKRNVKNNLFRKIVANSTAEEMGGHDNLIWPLKWRVIGYTTPLIYLAIWFGLRWDANHFEKTVPHDFEHKPWLYYTRPKPGDHSDGGHH